ncbi:dynein light chain Tctex-type protein 2B-like isoform X1 [Crotalus tigris]|uniref:dynein light chain Tctex-type protein 2B-like isoform X1 n=1 Tax=Crotalus tigris TaxID=88082 RepID=UPI00192F9CC7|nr:dynein light chain Tctex-type protein 2B-like isoform X1 [Crotalus tigris]
MAEPAPPLTPTPTTTPTPVARQSSAPSPARAYHLRPAFHHRFRSSMVKDCIHEILKEELANVQYNPEEIGGRTKVLSELIRDRLKGLSIRLHLHTGDLLPANRALTSSWAEGCCDFF